MLISTKELLSAAQKQSYAIGAFNVYNLEGAMAVREAAQVHQSPAMLQMHPSALEYGGKALVSLCLEVAREATVPMSVQLDHSSSEQAIREALDAGMSSIMADGSPWSYDKNLEFTLAMTNLAHDAGAAVEAEIGRISGSEDSLTVEEKEAKMTDPVQAVEFVQATNVDSLAVTIGNVHGKYHSEPRLDFDRLEKIHNSLDLPLVLHGASGLPESMVRRSIELGVCKFNVNAQVRAAFLSSMKQRLNQPDSPDLLEVMNTAIAAMSEVIAEKLELFGSVGKASLHG